ncbi:IS701 family transposase [Frankia gtarii]|uniref:IS701 family transposase n=1 Tax=Frankia gtarii TaxID=2950102 RepID=UPI0021C128F8|nr:transposase [Frankia gtarii]
MLPDAGIPVSLAVLLECFQPCFTAPTFQTFRLLVTGMLAAPARRTVVGMLVGAARQGEVPHDRAHRFLARAVWSIVDLSDALARLVVERLVGDGPITVAIDDTLFHRRGKKVFAAGYCHDGSARGESSVGHGNNWVITALVLPTSVFGRPLCLPIGASLVVKDTMSASRLWLAARAAERLARLFPTRTIHVVADSAYAGRELRTLPANVTWTTRPRADAALFALAPPRTGRRGRPRTKGDRLGTIRELAAAAAYEHVTVTRYGRTDTVGIAVTDCLWYSVFGPRTVRLVLLREPGRPLLALITTDLAAIGARIVERYASRWAIETAIEDAKQLVGHCCIGEVRHRGASDQS